VIGLLVACESSYDGWEQFRSDEPNGEVVYESVRLFSAHGELLDLEEEGTWSYALAERVARPWLHVNDGVVHDELAWHLEHSDGTSEAGYRVTAVTIDAIEGPPADHTTPAPVLSPGFADELSSLDADTEVGILVRIAGWTREPLPWVPHRSTVSAEDYEAFLDQKRWAAAAQRQALADAAETLMLAIEQAGGSVHAYLLTGSVAARLPAGAVAALASRADVERIRPDRLSEAGAHTWEHVVGDPVPLGDLRSMTGVQTYINAGWDGKECQFKSCWPGYHLGVIESVGFKDNACYQGWDSCSTARQRTLFDCTGAGCTTTTGFANQNHHGTHVTSIALGDYSHGQAAGYESSIAPNLPDWEDEASGFALRGGLDYYATGPWESDEVQGYECARGLGHAACQVVDVINYSKGHENGQCDAASWNDIEGALEEAWDDGVLPVAITHNNQNLTYTDECRVRDPADIPKALAVGAIEPSESSPYHSWPYVAYSNRGGGPSKVYLGSFLGWYTYPYTMSMVDLVASGRPGYVTSTEGRWGGVSVDGSLVEQEGLAPKLAQGTSFAAPQVAGAALLVKQRHLDLGHTWISNPGRLHAAMLSMGDRATLGSGGAIKGSCISGDRIRCGADRYYGLGRLTVRRHNRFWMRTRTFTSSTPTTIKEVWSTPLNSNHQLVKCVMQQREDMVDPDKDNISRIFLRIQIIGKDPQGNCSVDGGDVFMTVDDDAPDDKHMVATTDQEVALADRCVQFVFTKASLNSVGSVATHTYCVAHTNLDYD
jgi:subtilisin family serine protease